MTNQNEIKIDTLIHFSEQIRSWCLERLHQQPGPFRQVELSDQFISDQRITSPPITLWVNRESFIAGAVILIPPKNEEDSFQAGREIAGILGLPCFFTWGRREISCWSTSYDPPEREWTYDLPHDDISSPATFRKSFNLLMDQLEKSFYTHQQIIPDASALHLANLVFANYNDLLPMLQQTVQIESPDAAAEKTSLLKLRNYLFLQLLLPLALTTHDILPQNIPVDKTAEILAKTALQLPAQLKNSFSNQLLLPDMPKEYLRRFNLYVSRVAQLQTAISLNLEEVTSYLINKLAPALGGHQFKTPDTDLDQIIINPDHSAPDVIPSVEIAEAGILSAFALLREIKAPGTPAPNQLTDVMALNQKLPRHHILGTLHETAVPHPKEHKKLNTYLRVSWPNHKLSLPARTPTWYWQLLHLCGLIEDESCLDLTIPENWLWDRHGEHIPRVLDGKVTFVKIVAGTDNMLTCTIQPASSAPVSVILPDGSERILPDTSSEFLRSQILIALNMPAEIFNLLSTSDLRYYTIEQIEAMPVTGLTNFLKSTLGKHLWNILAPGRPAPRQDKLAAECSRLGVPLPGEGIIASLGKLKGASNLSTADIDQELSVWLGTASELQRVSQKKVKASRETSSEDQLNAFLKICAKEEIPAFPENYLYEIPTTDRNEFMFHGRLKVLDSFFDETVLQDQKKQQITIQGTPQTEALLLISTARSGPVELPADQKAMTAILDRYIRDLKTLRQSFYRHAVTYLPEEDVLSKVEEVWTNHSLPLWELVKSR